MSHVYRRPHDYRVAAAASVAIFFAGLAGVSGSISQTLPSLSQSATASEEFTGTIAQTLPSVSQQSTGQASQFAVFTGVEATFSIGTFIASSISWTDVTLPGADSYSSVDTTTSNTYTDVC